MKIRIEINEIENKQTIGCVYSAKPWFFEKINNIDKP